MLRLRAHPATSRTMATSHAVEELMSGAGTKGPWCGHELGPTSTCPRRARQADADRSGAPQRRGGMPGVRRGVRRRRGVRLVQKKLCASRRVFSFVG